MQYIDMAKYNIVPALELNPGTVSNIMMHSISMLDTAHPNDTEDEEIPDIILMRASWSSPIFSDLQTRRERKIVVIQLQRFVL